MTNSIGGEQYARVYLLDAIYKIDDLYDYRIPHHLLSRAKKGVLAVVPFGGGNKARNAIIHSVSDETQLDPKKVKPLFDIPDTGITVSGELMELCAFMKDTCFCTMGEALRTVMPAGITIRTGEYYTLADGVAVSDETYSRLNEKACDILSYVAGNEEVPAYKISEQFGEGAKTYIQSLIRLGYLVRKTDVNCRVNEKTSRYVRLLVEPEDLEEYMLGTRLYTPKQLHVLKMLADAGGTEPLEDLCELSGAGKGVVALLARKGAVEYLSLRDYRSPYTMTDFAPAEDFSLSDEQDKALGTLTSLYEAEGPHAALLYGVTGSGKTNVLLKLIDRVIEDGRQVLFLVPEIALTTQNIAIFAGRYRDRVAVLHSSLSSGERLDAWHRISSGDADIVIGTRSAVFAPVTNLGLIVIDEEQEGSFKSDMSPKYHARDMARFRCARNDALLVLASATPSLESFYKAQTGKYTLVTMKNRYGRARLPRVIIYDMKSEPMAVGADGEGLPPMIGRELDMAIRENLKNGEQTILFINRRGYHAFVTCRDCGNVVECPHCSVSLTYHKYAHAGARYRRAGEMACHYCGYTADPPKVCPSCGSEHIAYCGSGTQTLEEYLGELYPQARVLRMDTDTTSGKLAHEEILGAFRRGEADILVGTQMVTKGHDFPNVTLVGVILADTSLYLNDFRANERTFSLITQVLGRAGRAEKAGRAIIQTYSPDNDVLRLAAKQDYDSFYDGENRLRRASVFPPYCDLVSFLFSGENETQVRELTKAFGERLDLLAKSEYRGVRLIVFGPIEASVYKIAGKYRLRYIIKCKNDKPTRALLQQLLREFSGRSDALSVSVDVNPTSL